MKYFWSAVFSAGPDTPNSGEFTFWQAESSEKVEKLAKKLYKDQKFEIGETTEGAYESAARKGNS